MLTAGVSAEMTKRAIGLGKRKRDQQSDHEETEKINSDEDGDVFFPMDENSTELEQLSVMYESAEALLDEPSKCLPLFRAVVHECDRIIKNLECSDEKRPETETETESKDKSTDFKLVEQVDSKLYRLFGDALYQLAFLEDEEQKDGLLQAAKEIYETGLQEFPKDEMLQVSYARQTIVCFGNVQDPSNENAPLPKSLTSLPKLIEKTSNQLEVGKLLLPAISQELDSLAANDNFANLIRDICEALTPEKDSIELTILKLNYIKLLIECYMEIYNVNAIPKTIDEASSLLSNLEQLSLAEPFARELLELQSFHQIWKGSFLEMTDDENELSQEHYQKAVEIWQVIAEKYNESVPEYILELAVQKD